MGCHRHGGSVLSFIHCNATRVEQAGAVLPPRVCCCNAFAFYLPISLNSSPLPSASASLSRVQRSHTRAALVRICAPGYNLAAHLNSGAGRGGTHYRRRAWLRCWRYEQDCLLLPLLYSAAGRGMNLPLIMPRTVVTVTGCELTAQAPLAATTPHYYTFHRAVSTGGARRWTGISLALIRICCPRSASRSLQRVGIRPS